jgi:hypothetical protein
MTKWHWNKEGKWSKAHNHNPSLNKFLYPHRYVVRSGSFNVTLDGNLSTVKYYSILKQIYY